MPPKKMSKSKRDLTFEEKEAIKIKARRQFKACTRIVLNNSPWYAKPPVVGVHKKIRSIPSLFSLKDKILLRKHASLRTEAEILYLFKMISNTKLFQIYPMEVRIAVCGRIYFGYYEEDRLITRQGHDSTILYFLLSGEILVFQEVVDPILQEQVTEVVGKDLPGSMFGEIGILNNAPRRYSRRTLTPIEFLYITQEDLRAVLKETVQDVWDVVEKSLAEVPYFKAYNMKEIREVVIVSKLLEYKPEDVVLGSGFGLSGHTHIILEGLCQLIECLLVIPNRKRLQTSYRLYDDDAESEQSDNSSEVTSQKKLPPFVEAHYMQICSMKKGSTFNVGENLKHRTVLAITPVKCVAIPKYYLLTHDNGNIWISLQQFLNRHIPSSKQILDEFVNNQKWLKYRKMLQDDLISQHNYPSYNIDHNIPPFYRVQLQISKD